MSLSSLPGPEGEQGNHLCLCQGLGHVKELLQSLEQVKNVMHGYGAGIQNCCDYLDFCCLILLVHLAQHQSHVSGHLVRGITRVTDDGNEGCLCRGPEPNKANILPEELGRPRTARGLCVTLGPLGIFFTHLEGVNPCQNIDFCNH